MGFLIRKILAANIGRLFKARDYGSAEKAAEAIGVPKSTIDRAWRDRSSAKLDTLEDMAAGLKIQPWQLLVPDLDPLNLPRLAGCVDELGSSKEVARQDNAAPNNLDDVARLIALYGQSTPEGRKLILGFAGSTKKISAGGGERAGNDEAK